MRCFTPTPIEPEPRLPARLLLKHSLDQHERRRCSALKGWRTRREKEMNDD